MKVYNCIGCGKESIFTNQKKNKFCSVACQASVVSAEFITDWKNGKITGSGKYGISNYIKNYMQQKYQCCSECGVGREYNGKELVLEIDHIDGNAFNQAEENLRLICPNCHSQTSNYKNRNKNSGRTFRSKYFTKPA